MLYFDFMNKSEFHQAPLVRVVTVTGLEEDQGEGGAGSAEGPLRSTLASIFKNFCFVCVCTFPFQSFDL